MAPHWGQSLAQGRDGTIWAATMSGLYEVSGGRLRRYGTVDGLVSESLVSVLVDSAGTLWVGAAPGGLMRVAPPGLANFGRRDGLLTDKVSQILPDGHGSVLLVGFPPAAGVHRVEGDRLVGTRFALPSGIRELGFVGISLAAGGTVGFQHRLGRQEWSALAAERRLHLAGMSPGRYQLAVRAVRSDGATSETASVEIVVPTPLWRRWWVVTADALLVLGGVTLAWRARRRRRRDLERVRSRIAADLHDELGLSLSRIAVLSEVARRKADAGLDTGGAEMREVGDEARDLIDATSDMAWALDPRSDDLPSLLARLRRMMADVFDGTGLAWSFAGPDTTAALALGAEQRRHLYLILKEAVHNAARHARANRVEVRVGLERGMVTAEVSDDGVGFDPGGADAESGHGMTSMRRRAEELGGTLEVITGHGSGTLVRVVAPLGGAA
jgi:signal transduction histidine kinase